MRKFIFSILLASAAASPALAQDQGDRGRWHHDTESKESRQERQQVREERAAPQAEERQQVRQERAARQVEAPPQQVQREVRQQVQGEPRGHFDRSDRAQQQQVEAARQSFDRGSRNARGQFAGGQADQAEQARQDGGSNRDRGSWNRGDSGRTRGDLRQSDRQVPNVMRTRNPLVVDNTQREATQSRRWSNGNWNSSWRNDRRYDWRHYRDHHRSTFRLGIYYDPFGYGYQSFNIGYRLFPNYYSRNYWIDPAMYQLPYPPPGTEWVRYWNDALLVDTYTGEVVDVIRNFFW